MFWNSSTSSSSSKIMFINRKHEMFWNGIQPGNSKTGGPINRKHEMFWNYVGYLKASFLSILTVNMKCFEIDL